MERFIIFSPGYNCKPFVRKHMESINNQTFSNYVHMVCDDGSNDGTWQEINKYKNNKTLVYRNKKNMRKSYNSEKYLRLFIQPDDIIINIDLDDWLYHERVLERINEIYTREEVWTTYGFYEHLETDKILCKGYPQDVVENMTYRQSYLYWHHPRTWKGFLFQKIKSSDFIVNNEYIPHCWDLAVGFPVLEMSPPNKQRFIPEKLMVYNANNPLRIPASARNKSGLRDHFKNAPRYKRLRW